MTLRFIVLGPFLAFRDAEPLDTGHTKQQALLAALLLRPGVTVSREELIDGVWGDRPPATGRDVVANYVHRLRRQLGAQLIVTEKGGYRFLGGPAWVDATHLKGLVLQATAAKDGGDHSTAFQMLTAASELFRGEPLAGLPGPFAHSERLRLLELRTTVRQELAECCIRLGRHTEAISELAALTDLQPLNEAFAGLLMHALYKDGRQADALDVFTRTRKLLAGELGIEPGPELQRIQQAVLRRDDTVLFGGTPAQTGAAPSPAVRSDLPAARGAFVGRAAETARIAAAAAEYADTVAVVAIDGMAGAGKTALALRAAHSLADKYPDGRLFLDLYGYRADREALSPERAVRRLLRSIGVDDSVSGTGTGTGTDDGGRDADEFDDLVASWRDATTGRRLLLVLDDVAQAEHVRPLIPSGAGSLVIVTSRRHLPGLDADSRISLGTLGEEESVGLLTRIVGGELVERESAATRDLVRLCAGLPLALRIVGARLQGGQSWAIPRLAERLADGESGLAELTAEDRSVEAAFRLSYDQLPPADQAAFRALGSCPTIRVDELTLAAMLGGSARDARQALANLDGASLVELPGPDRYQAHELLAAFARSLASADPRQAEASRASVFRLHLIAARCASDWGPAGFPTGPDVPEAAMHALFADRDTASAWLDAAGGELVDLVVLAAREGRADDACWIAEALVDYLTREGRYHECRTAISAALPLTARSSDRRMASSLLTCMGISHGAQGRLEPAIGWLNQALDISVQTDDVRERARALGVLGTIARLTGRPGDALAYMTEVDAIGTEIQDDWLVGMATCNIGAVHQDLGRFDEAAASFAESMVRAERIGSPRLIGKTLHHVAGLRLERGDHEQAAADFRRAAELAGRAKDVPLRAVCLTRQGTAEERLGNLAEAVALHRQALAELGDQVDEQIEDEIRRRLADSLRAHGPA